MDTNFFLIAVILLIGFAAFDLVVGVSNDAVNFLNSSIGSKVAPRTVILIVASLGILAGVTFSSGMMEVARKGIFHPQFFTMPDLLTIFLGVMLTDIILLDFFNTFGFPTSTTVSIVFELLGGAVAVSMMKIIGHNGSLSDLGNYINTGTALFIIFGILLSVIVSFFFGAMVQFFTRLLFTFDYMVNLRRFGALWGGVAMASIFYFILVKGAKGASFLTPEATEYINNNAWTIMFWAFIASTIVFQILLFFRINILKPLILIGTFAIAMAFAANDLVNFIGVPLAGLFAFRAAAASENPLTLSMGVLSKKVQTDTYLLLIAGIIMVITLWFSKKARTVSQTEINLGQQEEGVERFESARISRMIVRMWLAVMDTLKLIIPQFIRSAISERMDPKRAKVTEGQGPSWDLMRASVNLMVASGCISYATSHKLPLSTTYVTFMVAMGSSFADRAWGRDSAVYRITGVLTVIGGWFMTAISAFISSAIVATAIYFSNFYAVPVILIVFGAIIWKNHKTHGKREVEKAKEAIFNLKKIKDAPGSIATTFEHMNLLIKEIRESLDTTLHALFTEDLGTLKFRAKRVKTIQTWCNIITANIFKSMRLLQKNDFNISGQYSQTIRRLQQLADLNRDITLRAMMHVDNQHKGLIEAQIKDLEIIKQQILDIFLETETIFTNKKEVSLDSLESKHQVLKELALSMNQNQVKRIVNETSKTRLSILFYTITENSVALSKQLIRLTQIFQESFGNVQKSNQ
ncbi:MAG: inorganic phosphate transporter [Fibrobacteria bacterium]|nr:inorganic phosphate transporter [Fibrobacteria bacterium]